MSKRAQIINISGANSVDDPEYRYKMPTVVGKIEGRGNGIKTVIANISDLGLSLHRPAPEVNKFFGCELGAQTTYSEETDRAVVNGAHTDTVLQVMMHRYIEYFVLCPSCHLPETEYKIKNDIIYHRCKACGAKEMVNMQHKLCTFILAQNKKAKAEKKKNDKKDRKNKKDKKDSDEEKEKKKDKKDKKKKDKDKKDKKKDKKDKKKKEETVEKNPDYIEDAMFGKEEDDLADAMDDLSIEEAADVDDEGALALAVTATKTFLAENPNASPEDLAEVAVNQQMASALKSYDKVHIFIRAAITPDFFKNKEIEKYAPVISLITNSNPIMERHLIAALEAQCTEKPKTFPVMIKQFFDEDALDEDVILEYASEGRSEYTLEAVDEDTRAVLRGEMEPLVVWLQEADSDDDDDSDGE